MTTRSTARHLHLARTARVAGEAFAFVDHEAAAGARRFRVPGALIWLFVAAAAGLALYTGF